ncbi:MAG TPA: hypothetical protein DCP84_06645 [Pseudomonas sp.]|nr:hypothetical protein [Pseudomonas sp.]
MPTENRSSNTESKIQTLAQHPEGRRERFQKWVLATKHPVLGYLDGTWLARGDDREGYADKYVQGLWVAYKEFGQPAQQPHPDPIAWMVGTAFWWTKEEAERDAAATGLQAVPIGPMASQCGEPVWFMTEGGLSVLHAKAKAMSDQQGLDTSSYRVPLYTHADPAEVERLRGWVSAYKESRERLHEWFREEQLKNISLRAQLDELVSAVRSINYGPAHAVRVPDDDEPCYPQRKEWIEWLFGLCDSASAEPSAPVDATHYYPKAELGRQWRKKVGGLWCEFCGGKWLPLDVQDMSHGYVAIEPSAPVEIDERAEFELAYQRAADCGWTSTKMLSRRIWDARAALERKPITEIPEGYCVMPRSLTAKNGAKALLLGEFKLQVTRECPECAELEEPAEGCEICDGAGEYGQRHTIPWVQIKFIYSEAVKGLALK